MTLMSEQTLIERAVAWWNQRREASAELAELGALSGHDAAALAAECGVTVDRLVAAVRSGRHGSDEMLVMMQALGIDPDRVDAMDRMLFNDMAATCATCGHKGECRGDLASGEAEAAVVSYCANGDTLSALRIEPSVQASV